MKDQLNAYGVLETNKPHPAPKTEISTGTVLQILREGSDYYHKYEAARARLRKELGWEFLPLKARVSLDLQLKEIVPLAPEAVTMAFVERICRIAEKAREE